MDKTTLNLVGIAQSNLEQKEIDKRVERLERCLDTKTRLEKDLVEVKLEIKLLTDFSVPLDHELHHLRRNDV